MDTQETCQPGILRIHYLSLIKFLGSMRSNITSGQRPGNVSARDELPDGLTVAIAGDGL